MNVIFTIHRKQKKTKKYILNQKEKDVNKRPRQRMPEAGQTPSVAAARIQIPTYTLNTHCPCTDDSTNAIAARRSHQHLLARDVADLDAVYALTMVLAHVPC